MKIYTAGVAPCGGGRAEYYQDAIMKWHPYILESFYYADETTEKLLPYFGDFLLDSGAFTFMQGNHKGKIDWNEYVDRYADFITRNHVEKFFELDIDSVVGYEAVIKLREKLERLTNRQSIPVWHKSRGIAEYKRHCEEYPYVGIGGYVIKELQPKDFEAFPAMIRIAHANNAKVHCLGFTRLSDLSKYHFDSVDSTAWTIGNRFGCLYQFNGKTMVKHDKPPNHRLADSRRVALHNYTEWIKFQKYAERNL